jgi:hypothetical protein
MLKHDYILRLIEQIARVFARLLQRVSGDPQQALGDELDRALQDLSGLSLDLVATLSLDGLLEMLRADGEPDVPRTLAVAELLYLHALVRERQGDESGAFGVRVRALTLYLETLIAFRHERLAAAAGRADELMEALRQHDLPDATSRRLFRYLEVTGRLAEAEDVLFEMIERGSGGDRLVAEGIAFYERLLECDDAFLDSGNLPRDEIIEGLDELRQGGGRGRDDG